MTNAVLPFFFVLLSACARVGSPVSPSRTASSAPAAGTFATEVVPVPVANDGTVPRMVDVRITSVERTRSAGEETVRAVIAWTGRGAGTFAIEGPAGTLIATGVVLPGERVWFRDVSDRNPFSDLMSRGLAFDQVEPAALRDATLRWLNEVVAPALEAHLRAPVARP